jgi:hypothetical protein
VRDVIKPIKQRQAAIRRRAAQAMKLKTGERLIVDRTDRGDIRIVIRREKR